MELYPDSRRLDVASPAASFSEPVTAATPIALRSDAAPPAAPPAEPERDAHGHDPDAYDWYPVLRKARPDGWTPDAQRAFIEALADTGSVMQAAQAVGMTRSSAYKLRRSPGAEGFAAAWSAAIGAASQRALDDAFERALVGSDEPVFDRDGRVVGRRFRQSDRLLMFILRAYMPERFRYAAREVRQPDEPLPPPPPQIAQALALLEPERPADPAAALDAETLAARLECADSMDGERPSRHRQPGPEAPDPMPIDETFERLIADASHAASGRPPLTDAEWADHRNMLLARNRPGGLGQRRAE
jgi:hypothetical protein